MKCKVLKPGMAPKKHFINSGYFLSPTYRENKEKHTVLFKFPDIDRNML